MSNPTRTSKRKRTPTKRYQQEEDFAPMITRQTAKRQRQMTKKQTAERCHAPACKKQTTGNQLQKPNSRRKTPKQKKKKLPLCTTEQDVMDMFSISEDSGLSSDEDEIDKDVMVDHMILPHLANYLSNNPDQPPESYFFKHYHRLSQQDLLFPIKDIHHITSVPLLKIPSHADMYEKELSQGVYITVNELEAIQGLSRFSSFNSQE